MPPAVIGGAIAAAGAVGSAVISSKASKQAAQAQMQGADAATQAQLKMYYQTRKDIKKSPHTQVGDWAVRSAQDLIMAGPKYKDSKFYNYLLKEQERALDRRLSAMGRVDSGPAYREALRQGTGLAATYRDAMTNEWLKTRLNPRLALAGSGQVMTSQLPGITAQTGAGLAQNYLLGGQAQAGGAINRANALTGGIMGVGSSINQGLNNYLFQQQLQRQQQLSPASNYLFYDYWRRAQQQPTV